MAGEGDFEALRAEALSKRAAIAAELGLTTGKRELESAASAARESAAKRRRELADAASAAAGPSRRSLRVQGLTVEGAVLEKPAVAVRVGAGRRADGE
jgi:hypothetical protein